MTKAQSLKELMQIPSIGKSIAEVGVCLGVGVGVFLYAFRCAVYFAGTEEETNYNK